MALSSTMYRFNVDISDVDRDYYSTVEFRAAQHPSESDAYLVTRVLAMCLEHREGLVFGRGVSSPEEPALYANDAMGNVDLWVEIGNPAPERLHKAAKQANSVVVYVHKNAEIFVASLAGRPIHRAAQMRLVMVPPALIDAVGQRLVRSNNWSVLRNAGMLYVTAEGVTVEGALEVTGL